MKQTLSKNCQHIKLHPFPLKEQFEEDKSKWFTKNNLIPKRKTKTKPAKYKELVWLFFFSFSFNSSIWLGFISLSTASISGDGMSCHNSKSWSKAASNSALGDRQVAEEQGGIWGKRRYGNEEEMLTAKLGWEWGR